MNKNIVKVIKDIKDIIFLTISLLSLFIAVIMITEDIKATICFGTISIICAFLGRKILIRKKKDNVRKASQEKEYEDLENIKRNYNSMIKRKQIDLEYQKKLKQLDEESKKLQTIEPTDTEIKVTIEKIQELYKNQNIDVKVINVKKIKYCTEYEVFFSLSKTTKEMIFEVSDKIINEFNVDGIKINNDKNKPSRIYILVPYEYGKI